MSLVGVSGRRDVLVALRWNRQATQAGSGDTRYEISEIRYK